MISDYKPALGLDVNWFSLPPQMINVGVKK